MAEVINTNVFAADKKFVDFAGLDYYVRKRYIPHGRQEIGFKEIFWYKKDILKYKEERDSKKKK